MSLPDIVKGTYVDMLYGDGEDPEVFTAFCGLNTKTFTRQANTNDVFVRDCALPESVPHRRLNVTGQQWDLSGDGLMNMAQREAVDALFAITANFQFYIDRPVGSVVGAGAYEGPAKITNLQYGGTSDDGAFVSVSMAIASDGEWAYTPKVAPP